MAGINFTYLNGPDIEKLAMTDAEILAAVEAGLIAQGKGECVIEPRMHLTPDPAFNGHFNVLRGYVAPLNYAGVKIVGDYVDNYKRGLPSEMALLNLFDPETGMPKAILDATAITEMRTGALTALGAKYLGPKTAKRLGHIGARGTAYWNVRLLDSIYDFEDIRVHSRRKESRDPFAEKLSADLGKPVTATEDWESCLDQADILVEASRLPEPKPLFKREWVKKGAFVVPYGTMSTLPLDFTDIMDKIVVDDRGQMRAGHLGALRPHIDAGKVSETSIHGELGEVAVGSVPGREREDETILFWHRGLSLSDIALGAAMLAKAEKMGLGQTLEYA
ncbi:ornithine cyclodeaminase family protein [Pacificispira sp.]|uniref:ornithine cyclodeaminase family protein n=1 Tax=Pacificispira sp. TaxID=2888761 RepID=UPI003B5296A6